MKIGRPKRPSRPPATQTSVRGTIRKASSYDVTAAPSADGTDQGRLEEGRGQVHDAPYHDEQKSSHKKWLILFVALTAMLLIAVGVLSALLITSGKSDPEAAAAIAIGGEETSTKCKNEHELCSFWSETGECETNPDYMKVNCALACDSCEDEIEGDTEELPPLEDLSTTTDQDTSDTASRDEDLPTAIIDEEISASIAPEESTGEDLPAPEESTGDDLSTPVIDEGTSGTTSPEESTEEDVPTLTIDQETNDIASPEESTEEDVPIFTIDQEASDTASPEESAEVDLPTSTIDEATATEDAATEEADDEVMMYDAVIIGAGWSAISAARTLSESGVSSILLLEANDYVGGRSKTTLSSNGVVTDLGSEWLYKDENAQAPYLEGRDDVQLGVLGPYIANVGVWSQTVGDNSERITTKLDDMDELDEKVWGEFLSHKKDLLKSFGDISYADAIEQFMLDKDITDNTAKQYLNWMVETYEAEYGGDAKQLSLSEVMFSDYDLETYYMGSKGAGFGNAAVQVANDLDADIKLNSKVVAVNYEDDENVIITYEEKGTPKKVMARTALVTVPLGVLKANTISFTPDLPERKQDAIDNMGYGLLNKAIMYWNNEDDIVWPEDEWMELITAEDELSGVFTSFINPSRVKGAPCLIAWIAGDEAVAMEEKSDEEVLEQVMLNLRSMFPTITDPDEIMVTRWGQDENFLGSYSFNKVGRIFLDDAENLKERVGNVWFAGEATNLDDWHATTVGAWETGDIAAEEMAKVLDK